MSTSRWLQLFHPAACVRSAGQLRALLRFLVLWEFLWQSLRCTVSATVAEPAAGSVWWPVWLWSVFVALRFPVRVTLGMFAMWLRGLSGEVAGGNRVVGSQYLRLEKIFLGAQHVCRGAAGV